MFLLIYFLIGVAYVLFAVRYMDPDVIKIIRDDSGFGAFMLLWIVSCWPFYAVGSLLRLFVLCVSRKREGDDDSRN